MTWDTNDKRNDVRRIVTITKMPKDQSNDGRAASKLSLAVTGGSKRQYTRWLDRAVDMVVEIEYEERKGQQAREDKGQKEKLTVRDSLQFDYHMSNARTRRVDHPMVFRVIRSRRPGY
jgi:hypothetical protein